MVKHWSLEGSGAAAGGAAAGTLDATFGALSDATRRGILAQLATGETTVSELAAPYEMSLPAVSKHLRVLEGAGLVTRHKDGRVHRCRLIAEPMKDAAAWIERYRVFWEEQFDALERYLAETGALTAPPKPELVRRQSRSGEKAISNLKFEISKKAKTTAGAKREADGGETISVKKKRKKKA
jgi:DNA-binding transcriptional ArsR family regulator